jgi:hypothetical protein
VDCCKSKEWSGEKGRGIAREYYDNAHMTVTFLDDEGVDNDNSDSGHIFMCFHCEP